MSKYRLISRPQLRGALVTAAAVTLAACASRAPESHPEPAPPPPPPPAVREMPPAAPVALREDAPLTYVVKAGDTLWDIANRFLLDPWQWPEVWIVNDQVANPHRIYPGDVLKLVWRDGRPGLARVAPAVRDSNLDSAIATIPVEAIRHFLRSPRLVQPEEYEAAPYVLAFDEERLVGSTGNEAYIRRLPAEPASLYALFRRGQLYRDPDDGAVLGIEAIPIGEVEIAEPGDPAVSFIVRSEREALSGDRLLPIEDLGFETDFYPHAPAGPVGGRIIAVFDGVSQIGQYQIIAINRGSNHGLESGQVVTLVQEGGTVTDQEVKPVFGRSVKLPDRPAGQAMVFKVTPRLSFALVMEATRSIYVQDKVENPVLVRR